MAKAIKTNNVAANLVKREFEKYGPRKVLLTDITYIPFHGEFCYLSTILDAFTKQILSYVLSESLEVDFVLETVNIMVEKHGISLSTDTIIHSDQGCHYTSCSFIQLVKDKGLRQSMSRRGNCWDNAPQESFFGRMKDHIENRLKTCTGFLEVKTIIDDWMDYYNNERYQYEELELRDDFMFGKVMQNKELCKRTLEILLGIEIEDIEYPEAQKTINITCQGKSVRMDVYVADNTNTVYNAEMQQQGGSDTQEQLPKRSRYYQGMIDLNLIEKGFHYTELNNSYVIFICTFDPFGRGRYQYTFRHLCEEDTSLVLEDGTTKIFYNTKGNLEHAPEKLRDFLHYIEAKEVESPFTEALDREVERIRRNEKWRREYMKELLHDFDIKEAGRKEGLETGRKEGEERALRNSIYDFLRDLGEIPEDLTKKIEGTTDIAVLQGWVKLAARSRNMEEFMDKMN